MKRAGKNLFTSIVKRLFRKTHTPLQRDEEVAMCKQILSIEEQDKKRANNFGNAGGFNPPSDYNRGLGGRAIEDHLIHRPKANP